MAHTKNMNMVKLIDNFHSEEKCRAYLEELRWPEGVICPRCKNKSVSQIKKRFQYDCNSCRYQFSVTAGTIFHDSHLPLWKWFAAMYLMIESKKGISANQMKRTIGVSYKTAWYLCHRIRKAMTELVPGMLKNIVEVDESYVAGKAKGKRGRGAANKSIVAGAIERKGEMRLKVIKRADKKTLHEFIQAHADDKATDIMTDEWPAYRGIGDEDTKHSTVNHGAKESVNGNVHTNTMENVFSLLKRSIVGSYHKISTKHLDAYLDELEWRFNNRKNPYLFRGTLQRLVESEKLEYQDLINA